MKRLTLFFAALLCSIGMFAEPYYMVVGSNKYPLTANGESPYCTGNCQEYMATGISLNSGDLITFYDVGEQVGWAITKIEDGGASGSFSASSQGITCNASGCYNFYFKMEFGNDRVYIETSSDCSGGGSTGGGSTGGGETGGGSTGGGETGGGTGGSTSGGAIGGDFASSVPSQCGDIMLQVFYWDSYQDKGYGNTKWATLADQVDEINASFDMVWLPPSARSSGGTGYIPLQYSSQSSTWGSRTLLESLIAKFHAGNTRVIADIVINHAGGKSGWCDYYEQDFGSFGKFAPDASWITSDDEVWSGSHGCTKSSASKPDDGQGDPKNYEAARDWDHQQQRVRDMCKAYLKWMKSEMKYDGWRYDYCKGFHESHINEYNSAAKNYFSVMEWWDGNANTLKAAINRASNNTLTFDFATKYTAFHDGIAKSNYSKCKGAGLLGMGLSKYAVTFIDNHDTFGRSDSQDVCGKTDGSSINNSSVILQCNAYILSMPGVPCVFYPHWVKYKSEIKKMCMARHAAGVHSESQVTNESADGSGYAATIIGTKGQIRLLLGNKASENPGGQFQKACSGSGYAVWYTGSADPVLVINPGSSTFKDAANGIQVSMSIQGTSESGSIYYTLDGSEPTTSSTKYTAPITIKQTTTLKAFAVVGSKKTAVQTCNYVYKEPQTGAITVSFYKPADWAKVCLYAWSTDGSEKQYLGAWPGTEMTNEKDGWYSYTFDAAIKDVNFIFNCGSDACQTSDLWTDEDVCYSWSGGAEKLEVNCANTAVKQVFDNTALTIYPNPTRGTLYIAGSEQLARIEVYTPMGALVESMDVNTTSETLDVNGLQQGMYLLRTTFANGKAAVSKFVKQ